jgi:hypothetical protein
MKDMNLKKNKLPKWFNGVVYNTGEEVTNPFSKESYKLNNVELSMYDFIMGAQLMFNMGMQDESILNDYHKGLDWFRKNNPKAYMVLLD